MVCEFLLEIRVGAVTAGSAGPMSSVRRTARIKSLPGSAAVRAAVSGKIPVRAETVAVSRLLLVQERVQLSLEKLQLVDDSLKLSWNTFRDCARRRYLFVLLE